MFYVASISTQNFNQFPSRLQIFFGFPHRNCNQEKGKMQIIKNQPKIVGINANLMEKDN